MDECSFTSLVFVGSNAIAVTYNTCPCCVKVKKSVYIAKAGQQYDKALNNILLHVPNHALK